jgi:hypothetical protein
MLILDKTRALDRIVARSLPGPEQLPDHFRLVALPDATVMLGLALDPYAGLDDVIAGTQRELVTAGAR